MESNQTELWKTIEENGFYQVSTFGRSRSIARKTKFGATFHRVRYLSPQLSNQGYARLTVRMDDGTKKTFLLHRLVARAFIPNPENKPQINHKNFNRADNRIENLEWATASENNTHVCDAGRKRPWGQIKLKNFQVKEIKSRLISGKETHKTIALDYDVSASAIDSISVGRTWKYHQVDLEVK